MKKYTLTSLAALGLLSAFTQLEAAKNNIKRTDNYYNTDSETDDMDDDLECSPPSAAREKRLFSQLNAESRQLYNSLDCRGKNLAMQMAEQKCKGQNQCKGLNYCNDDKNGCLGKGECKGTAQGPFKDKNAAVLLAAKRRGMYQDNNNNGPKNNNNQKNMNNRYGY